jgi:hypothetical protein
LKGGVGLPLPHLTAVSKLDLSFNEEVVMGNDGNNVGIARELANMSALRVLGLRQAAASRYRTADLQAVHDIHRTCSDAGRPAPRMYFETVDPGVRPEHVCELDRETYFLDHIVN